MEKAKLNNLLRAELGEHLTSIPDKTIFAFDNGFDGHDYTGKELKKDPRLVHWLWNGDTDKFVPIAVLHNHTVGFYTEIEV